MRSTWSEPYLWVHLAGIAAVPIFLELCLLGIAASESLLPASLVFLLVAAIGITPIVWMQWQRPFCIFSLVFLALQPNALSDSQRQILQQFKVPLIRVVTVTTAIVALLLLWQLNRWVPLVALKAVIIPGGALGGFLTACFAFLLTNLFLQVPASVLLVLLTPESQIADATPYPVAQIPQDFTLIGLRAKQILPPVVASPKVASPKVTSSTGSSPKGDSSSVEPPRSTATTFTLEVSNLKQATELEAIEPEAIEPEAIEPEATELEATATSTTPEAEIPKPPEADSLTQPESVSTEPQATDSEPAVELSEQAETLEDIEQDTEMVDTGLSEATESETITDIKTAIEEATEPETITDPEATIVDPEVATDPETTAFAEPESIATLAELIAEPAVEPVAGSEELAAENQSVSEDFEMSDTTSDLQAFDLGATTSEATESESSLDREAELDLELAELPIAAFQATGTEVSDWEIADREAAEVEPVDLELLESDPELELAPDAATSSTEPLTETSEDFNPAENRVGVADSADATEPIQDIFPPIESNLTAEPESTSASVTEPSDLEPEAELESAPEPKPIVEPAPTPKAEPVPTAKAEPEPFSFRLEMVTPPNVTDTIVRINLANDLEAERVSEPEPMERQTSQPSDRPSVEDTIVRIDLTQPDGLTDSADS